MTAPGAERLRALGRARCIPHRLAARWRVAARTAASRWWLWPLGVFAATRLVNAVMIEAASDHQIAIRGDIEGYHTTQPTPADPGYFGVAANWDGQWYMDIALHGYPDQVERGSDGALPQAAWAFSPVFPLATRLLMGLTGQPFTVVAPLFATLCAAVGVVLLHRLLQETAGAFAARATTLLLCTAMAAPVLQIAYTEGPALLLLTAALLLLRRRRYAATAAVLVVLGLTRPVALAFLPSILAHAVSVDVGVMARAQRLRLIALLLSCLLAAGLWPLVVAVATGRPTAFLEIQSAWGINASVLEVAAGDPLAGVALLLMTALLLLIPARPGARAWGPELRAWAAAYPLYVLLSAPAAISMPRFFVLAIPLMWPFPERVHGPGAKRARMALVGALAAAGLGLQWLWIRHFLVLGPIQDQFGMP